MLEALELVAPEGCGREDIDERGPCRGNVPRRQQTLDDAVPVGLEGPDDLVGRDRVGGDARHASDASGRSVLVHVRGTGALTAKTRTRTSQGGAGTKAGQSKSASASATACTSAGSWGRGRLTMTMSAPASA